jgi:DNA mismatch endonuclease (patch repair protein)
MIKRSKANQKQGRTAAQISFNMSQVKSSGSKIERELEKALRRVRLRPGKHAVTFGRPDFVFVRAKIAVFCDSHFWHGHNWKVKKYEIKRNRSFWLAKISANMDRDRLVTRRLRRDGWIVFRFWEHQILRNSSRCAERVRVAFEARRTGT